MIVRRFFAIVLTVLLGVQVIREAAVTQFAALRPMLAEKVWPDHPSVELSMALTQIGSDAHARREINPNTFAVINNAAIKSPLSPQPFLVRGVQEETVGDLRSADDAFTAAQWRDPRSLAAAYFLASYDLRTGQILKGLEEAALLARLSPGGEQAVAPFIAAYAQDSSTWPRIRILFQSNGALEDQVLGVLAQNVRNAKVVLALADAAHRKADAPWVGSLMSSLIASGDFGQARAIWESISGIHVDDQLIYDTTFSSPRAPPPFNWALTSSAVGLAEREPGKRLHIVFYGNEDGVLAKELILLRPGTYHLQMSLVGAPVHPETLSWSVRCDKSPDLLGTVGISAAATHGWTFQVPPNCPAQWLELSGRSGDVSQQSDATFTSLNLTDATVK